MALAGRSVTASRSLALAVMVPECVVVNVMPKWYYNSIRKLHVLPLLMLHDYVHQTVYKYLLTPGSSASSIMAPEMRKWVASMVCTRFQQPRYFFWPFCMKY